MRSIEHEIENGLRARQARRVRRRTQIRVSAIICAVVLNVAALGVLFYMVIDLRSQGATPMPSQSAYGSLEQAATQDDITDLQIRINRLSDCVNLALADLNVRRYC